MAKKLSNSVIKNLSGEIDPITGLTPLQMSVRKSRADMQQYNQSIDGIEPLGDYFPTKSKYDEGMDYADVVEPNGVESYRHEQQPFLESLGSTLAQAATEVVAGTIEGAGYLLDLPQVARTITGDEKEFHNWLTEIGSGIREGVKGQLPIYTDPNKTGFQPGEWAWWANDVIPSLASTASIAIPVGGFMKGAGMLGKLIGATEKLAKLPSIVQFGAKGITSAVVSRQLENMMEANGVNQELRQLEGTQVNEAQAKMYRMNYGVELPTVKNPDGTFGRIIDANAAREIAAKGAANTYKANWAMVLQDIPQYLIGGTPFGKATQKLTKTVAKELGENFAPVVIGNVAKAVGNALGEGLEESYQYGAAQYSKEMAMADAGLINRRDLSTAIKDYSNDGDMWTSFVAGTLGGAVMMGGQSIHNKMISQKNGLKTADEKRVDDIKSWATKSKIYSDALVKLDADKRQGDYEDVQNDFRDEMFVNAVKNGNLQYSVDFLDAVSNAVPEELAKYNVDEATAANIKATLPALKQKAELIGKAYESNLNQLGNQHWATEATLTDVRMKDYSAKVDKYTNDAELVLAKEFPNFTSLTPKGQDHYRAFVELSSATNLLQAIESIPFTSKDATFIAEREATLDKLKENVVELKQKLTDVNYTAEDIAANKKVQLPTTANAAYVNLVFKRQAAQNRLDSQIEYSNNIHDPEWRAEQGKKADNNLKEAVKEVVANAKTAKDLSDTKARAAQNPATAPIVTKTIDKAASEELDGSEAFQPAEPRPEEPMVVDEEAQPGTMTSDSEALLAQRSIDKLATSEAEKAEKLEKILTNFFTDSRYKNNPALFRSERDKLESILRSAAEKSAGAEINGVSVSEIIEYLLEDTIDNPELFSERLKKIYADQYNGNGAARAVYNAVYKFYEETKKSTESAANAKATLQANNPQKDSTHPSSRDVSEIGTHRSGNAIYISTGEHSAFVPTKLGSSAVAVAETVSQSELNEGWFEIGDDISIEWNPKQTYTETNAATRLYQLVVYKDGKRHVVGFLPTASQSGMDSEATTKLRNELHDYFNPMFTKNKTSPQKFPNRTLSIAGFKTEYSVSTKTGPAEAFAVTSEHGDPIFEERGGYLIGYLKEKDGDTGIIHFPNQGAVSTISKVKSQAGDIFLGIPNPLNPSDVLIIHAFKRSLSDVAKNVEGGQELVDGIFSVMFDLSNPASFASVFSRDKTTNKEDSMSVLNDTLFISADDWLQIQRLAAIDGAMELGTEQNSALLDKLKQYYMTFKDAELNSINFNTSSGLDVRGAMFNTVMSPFIAVTSIPGSPLANTQILIPSNVRDSKTPAVNKNVTKTTTAAVKTAEVKSVLNGSQVEQMAEDAASAEVAKPSITPVVPVVKPKNAEAVAKLTAQIEENQSHVEGKTEDSKFYLIDGEKYSRVTSVMPNDFDGDSSLYEDSRIAGSKVDEIVRGFFNDGLATKPEGISQVAFDAIIAKLNEIKSAIDARGEVFLANNVVVYDTVEKIAGELDILSVDADGNIHIYDVKTAKDFSKYDKSYKGKLTKRQNHTNQLSAYSNLIHNQYGLEVKSLGIMPFQISYDEAGVIATAKPLAGIKIEYDSTIEKVIPRREKKNTAELVELFAEQPLVEKIVAESPAVTPVPEKRQRPPRLAPEERVNISAAIVGDIKAVEGSVAPDRSVDLRRANSPFRAANKTSELAWIHSKFPSLSIKDIEEIADVVNEVTKGGHTAWGAFYNASVYLHENFSEGTVYHEAFHAIFTLALSEKDKATLLAEAPSSLSEKDKNEYLADAFMDLIIADQMDKTLSTKIKRFFRKLAILVKSMWTSNVKDIRELADRADMGFYRKSVSSDKFVDSSVIRLQEGYSFARQKEAVESINNLLINQIIPVYRNSHPELSILTDAEVLNVITKDKENPAWVYRLVSDSIWDVVDNDTTISDEQRNLLEGLAFDMFDGQYRPTKLIADCVRSLSYTNNIELGLRDSKGTRVNFDDTVVDGENADGGRAVGEVYGVNFTHISSKFGASQRIKDAIRYTKTGEKNSFGLPKYVKYDDVYNTLLKDLSGSTSVGHVYRKLVAALPFHPEYQSLVDKMSDPLFSSDMLQAFSRVHMSYLVIYDDKQSGGTVITDANRNGVSTSIINKWANSVLSESQAITRIGDDTTFNLDIILANDAIFRKIADKRNGTRTTEDFIDMERVTTSMGFPIPAKVFQYIETQNETVQDRVYRGASSIKTIMDTFVASKNPFDIEGASEVKAVKYLANITKSAMPELFESSFVNSNGDKQYSHIVPTFFMKLVGKLHDPRTVNDVIVEYTQDDMFGMPSSPAVIENGKKVKNKTTGKIYNTILEDLSLVKGDEEMLKERLQVALISDYNYEGNSTTYEDMNAKDMASLTLKLYFNSTNGTYSWFRMPVLSDSGNMLAFRVARKTRTDAVAALLTLAGSEYRRTQSIAKGNGKDIKNYGAYDEVNKRFVNGNTTTGYSLMDMFNGFEGDPIKGRKKAEALIDEYFTKATIRYIESLKNLGVIVMTKDNKIDVKKSSLEARLSAEMNKEGKDLRTFIKDFLINDYLMRANMSLLTVGDPAFYKDGPEGKKVDYFKRAKEIFSPKSTPTIYSEGVKDEDGNVIEPESGYFPVKNPDGTITKIKVPAYYRSIYINDNEIHSPSGQMFGEAIEFLTGSKVMSAQKAKELRVAYGITKNSKGKYETTNQTDAQAYITLPFYRMTMISESKWTDKHQSAYDRMMAGKGTAKDIVLVMQPRKPFMYTQIFDKGIQRMVPVQHKNSEFLLLPQLVKNNPKLRKLMDHMVKENIGIANFESAVKTGLSGSVKATKVLEVKDGVEYETYVQNLDELESATIHEIPMIDRGMQMEVSEHHIDTKNNFGSQIRKIIMSDLMLGHDYVIDSHGKNKPISKRAEDLYDTYESIIVQNLKDAYEEVKEEFTIDGKIDWKKIHDLLLREGISRGESEQFERAIAYVGEYDRLALPLFHPVHSDRIQAILTSLFRNRVTKQKISGGAFVQLSSFGLANELKLVFDTKVDSYYEKLLKSGAIEFKDDDGNPCTL